MIARFSPAICLCFLLFACGSAASGQLVPADLRCEYLKDPSGIEQQHPRLSWEFPDSPPSVRGERQTAYQILVASTEELLKQDRGDLWDSGKVNSNDMTGIAYGGHPLRSNERCYWKVRAWDQKQQSPAWSAPASWTMGLAGTGDWHAQWIGMPENASLNSRFFKVWKRNTEGPSDPAPPRVPAGPEVDAWINASEMVGKKAIAPAWGKDRLEELQPATLMRREFNVASPVKRATLNFCGLGCCKLGINGKILQDRVLDPIETDYDRRAFYTTLDVTSLLRQGKNAIGVALGDGWYRQTLAWVGPGGAAAFGPHALLLQLEIEYADGRTEQVVSDKEWKCTPDGPLVKNAVYGGELYDARREFPGWDSPGFDDRNWSAAEVISAPTPKLQAELAPPVRITETVKAVALTNPKPGVWVYDLGSHFTGFARLKVNAPAGTAITLKFGESLAGDGTVYQPSSLNTGAKAVDTYVCKGGAEESWEPCFTYHSFRYVQMEGFPGKPTKDMVEGRFVWSAMDSAQEFECANPDFNRLHKAFVRTAMENAQSKWTDCPSREKTGWMTYPIYNILMHNFDAQPWLAKLVDDMEEKTKDFRYGNKVYPDVSRGIVLGRRGAWLTEQVISTILLPWELYLQYGDRRLIERHYPFMRDTMNCFVAQAPQGVLDSINGDWHDALPSLLRPDSASGNAAATKNVTDANGEEPSLSLRAEAAKRQGKHAGGGFSIHTTPAAVSTAYFHEAAKAMSAMANALGKHEDAEEYARLEELIKKGFIDRFYNPDQGTFESQTTYGLALWQGLIPDNSGDRVMVNLVRDIMDTHHGHFSTGQNGTDKLVESLTDAGRGDVTHTLMTQRDFPSFGLMLDNGSTTTWETWGEAILNKTPTDRHVPVAASRPLSHVQFTGVDSWFLLQVAGIRRDDDKPGFESIVFKPQMARQIGWARARYHSIRGWIESAYAVKQGKIELSVTVPPNTGGTVYVPTTNPASVTESGKPAADAPGVKFLRNDKEYAVFSVEPGSYKFDADFK